MRISGKVKRKADCGGFLWVAAAMLTALFVFNGTDAEAVHKGAGDLVCGSCHTMHNSQGSGSNTLGGTTGGSIVLLRASLPNGRADIHLLCLQCHAENGTGATASDIDPASGVTAPKVYRTTAWDGTGFDDIGSGGDFSSTGVYAGGIWTLNTADGGSTCSDNPSVGKGHSIGCADVVPPGAAEATAIPALSCTNCHDPHGTDDANNADINIFRNLKKRPAGGGGGSALDPDGAVTVSATSYVGGYARVVGNVAGATAFTGAGDSATANHYWPIINGSGVTSPQNTYPAGTSANGTGDAGISGWCTQCHDDWHEDGTGTTNKVEGPGDDQQDWRRHPVNNSIVDATRPDSGAGVPKTDFTHYSGIALPNRLPAAQNNDGGLTYYADNSLDRVFCFSCHFVHGSPYNDILRWDYTDSVEVGGQVGNSISSTVGCQICHNR